jgi:hypothetical protein
MNQLSRARTVAIGGICLCLGFGSFAYTRTQSILRNTIQKETPMTTHASGTFEVKLNPQHSYDFEYTLPKTP